MILIASRRPSESDSLINNLFFINLYSSSVAHVKDKDRSWPRLKLRNAHIRGVPVRVRNWGRRVKLKTGTGGTEYSKSVAFPYIIGNRRRSCRPVTLCHSPILEGPTAFRMWSATGFNPKTAMGSHSNLRNRVRFQMKMAWNMLSSSKSFSTRHRGFPVSHIVRLSFKIRIVSH